MDSTRQEQRREAKRERNRRDYRNAKAAQDHVLLRLDKGDLARLDAAGQAIGVSRAAFARMFLAPTLGAVAARMSDIDKARFARGQSLAQFLSAAIAASLFEPQPESQPANLAAADEFDALFGSVGGGG
jgi:hypothetical protein